MVGLGVGSFVGARVGLGVGALVGGGGLVGSGVGLGVGDLVGLEVGGLTGGGVVSHVPKVPDALDPNSPPESTSTPP